MAEINRTMNERIEKSRTGWEKGYQYGSNKLFTKKTYHEKHPEFHLTVEIIYDFLLNKSNDR